MNKKIMSLFLALSLCLSLAVPAFAADAIHHVDSGVDYVDITETSSLTSDEISKYSQYTANPPQNLSVDIPQGLSANDILSMSILIDTKDHSDVSMNLYTSSLLPTYLYACSDITEILETERSVYITYQTFDSETVYLTFADEGLVEQIVYDPLNDTAYMLSDEENTKIVNFRYGSSEIISDGLLDSIRECIVSSDYSEIQNNSYLSVDINELGQVMIAPKGNAISRSGVVGFTNEADLLRNLKADFPMLNNKVSNSSSVYCDYLNKNISFHGVDNRSGYVRVTADNKTFAASALVTAVGAYLNVTTGGALTILDAVGVGITIISGKEALMSSVKLYRSANYDYYFERYGLLYDSTRFNDYVEMVSYAGFGTFGGGYDSSNRFTWIRNPISTPETKDWSAIQKTSMSRYNTELTVYGYCERYYPLGWFDLYMSLS